MTGERSLFFCARCAACRAWFSLQTSPDYLQMRHRTLPRVNPTAPQPGEIERRAPCRETVGVRALRPQVDTAGCGDEGKERARSRQCTSSAAFCRGNDGNGAFDPRNALPRCLGDLTIEDKLEPMDLSSHHAGHPRRRNAAKKGGERKDLRRRRPDRRKQSRRQDRGVYGLVQYVVPHRRVDLRIPLRTISSNRTD